MDQQRYTLWKLDPADVMQWKQILELPRDEAVSEVKRLQAIADTLGNSIEYRTLPVGRKPRITRPKDPSRVVFEVRCWCGFFRRATGDYADGVAAGDKHLKETARSRRKHRYEVTEAAWRRGPKSEGQRTHVTLPHLLTDEIDAMAARDLIPRADMIRRLLAYAVGADPFAP